MNVKMSDPYDTEKLYPVLEREAQPPPTPLIANGHEYRLRSCSKILENMEKDAKHYGSTLKKYTRSRNTFSHLSGVTAGASVVLSASGLGTGMTGIGIPIGASLGALGGICGMLSLFFGLTSKKMSKKVSKHVDNVARAKATINSINSVVSKAMRDGVISDEEYKIVTNIDNVYNNRMASIRRSTNAEDLKKTSGKGRCRNLRVFTTKKNTNRTPTRCTRTVTLSSEKSNGSKSFVIRFHKESW